MSKNPKPSVTVIRSAQNLNPSIVAGGGGSTPGGGELMRILKFDTPGVATYQPPSGVSCIKVIVTGAGGGGGGVDFTASQAAGGTGGGAGATGIGATMTIESLYNIIIGAGGAGGVGAGGNNGSSGSNSEFTSVSFGFDVTSPGGNGGFGALSTLGYAATARGQGADGDFSGDLGIWGGFATPAVVNGGRIMSVSISGSSYWGTGQPSEINQTVITPGAIYGIGGQGAALDLGGSQDINGGDGAGGVVYIEEYSFT